MPTIEYQCRACGHGFKRLIFRGEKEDLSVPCPICGAADAAVSQEPAGLFNGIARFSSLASDTN
jgi:putative FmdB family regulatory protein